MEQRTFGHDVIAIGASAGGLEALRDLLRNLPSDFPGSIFVVVHIGASSHLAHVLSAVCPLPVLRSRGGDSIEQGKVYVAVPGAHLLLHDGHILLSRGPRENMARPAIDPLFRSAAATFGGRVVGIVLSGALNDGTAGLVAIKRCGGLAIVQDPKEAVVPDMPRSALAALEVDHVAKAADIAEILVRLVKAPAGATPDIPFGIRLEAAIAAQELTTMEAEEKLGRLSYFTCPECHGSLWEIEDGNVLRYRCHVGHAYTAEAILSAQAEEIERTLAVLLRSHRERAALARRMAERERRRASHSLADQLEARARDYEQDAELIRRLSESDELSEPTVEDEGSMWPDETERPQKKD